MLIFLLLNAFAQTSYVPPGKLLSKGASEIKGTARYWSSVSRVDSENEKIPFESGESFNYLEGEFQGSYGATKEFQIGGLINYRQNAAKFADPSASDTIETASSSGIQAFGINLGYGFKPVERMNYTLEAFYRYHPYTNKELDITDRTKGLVVGDDGGDYGAGLVMTYAHPSKNYLSFAGYYRRPGSELSPELNWQLEGALQFKWAALIAGVQGVKSLNKDAYTSDPEEKPAVNTGGSLLYNSINREWTAPYVGFNLALNKHWRIEGRYQIFTQVRSYDSGQLISVSLARREEENTSAIVDKSFKEYDLEATVSKVSPKKQFVIIDKGLANNVQVGQRFDFFHFDYLGGNVLLGRGVVIQVNADQAVVKITSIFSGKHPIKEGTIVRAQSK